MTKTIYDSNEAIELRNGYTGTHMACGPIEGSTVSEITFIGKEGELFFISVSRMMEFVKVYISDISFFNSLFYLDDNRVDMQKEINKLDKYASEVHDLELGDFESIDKSEYKEELYLALVANDHYYCSGDYDTKAWLAEYNRGTPMYWESECLLEDEDDEDEDE